MEAIDVMKSCTVSDNVVKLPDLVLPRPLYLEVAKSLNMIGGKWKGGRVQGFVFDHKTTAEVEDLLADLREGQKRNPVKEYQYFPTPDAVADMMVAKTKMVNGWSGLVLEPSAGRGALVRAIQRVNPGKFVDCCELMPENIRFLERMPCVNMVGTDFLTAALTSKYDLIVANPPFSKNQDIEHIRKMYDVLGPKGRLVTLASRHWEASRNKKETQFRRWLDSRLVEMVEIPSGAFKESGTEIGLNLLVIDKP